MLCALTLLFCFLGVSDINSHWPPCITSMHKIYYDVNATINRNFNINRRYSFIGLRLWYSFPAHACCDYHVPRWMRSHACLRQLPSGVCQRVPILHCIKIQGNHFKLMDKSFITAEALSSILFTIPGIYAWRTFAPFPLRDGNYPKKEEFQN